CVCIFFFSSRRRHTRFSRDWSSDVCSSDLVYYSHFKCNRQQIRDYPNLSEYLRELYQVPGVAETVDLRQIKQHYYVSQRTINPTQIVPVGPELDFDAPHGRECLS